MNSTPEPLDPRRVPVLASLVTRLDTQNGDPWIYLTGRKWEIDGRLIFPAPMVYAMERRGLVRTHRHHDSCVSGPTIKWVAASITETGKRAYAEWLASN